MANNLRLLPLRMMKESVESDLILDVVEDMIEMSLSYISKFPPNDLVHSAASDLTLASAVAARHTIAMFQPLPNWVTAPFAPTDYAVLQQANALRSTCGLNELELTKQKSTAKYYPKALSATGEKDNASSKRMLQALAFMILVAAVCFAVQNFNMNVADLLPSPKDNKLATPMVTKHTIRPPKHESDNVGRHEAPEIFKRSMKRPSLPTSNDAITTMNSVLVQESPFSSAMTNVNSVTPATKGNTAKMEKTVVSAPREQNKHTHRTGDAKATKPAPLSKPVQNMAPSTTKNVPASTAVLIQEPPFLSTMTFTNVFILSSTPLPGAVVKPVVPGVILTLSPKPVNSVAPYLSTWTVSPPRVVPHTLAEPKRVPFLVKLRNAIFKRMQKFLSRFRRAA
jgi:hypothetical protein